MEWLVETVIKCRKLFCIMLCTCRLWTSGCFITSYLLYFECSVVKVKYRRLYIAMQVNILLVLNHLD